MYCWFWFLLWEFFCNERWFSSRFEAVYAVHFETNWILNTEPRLRSFFSHQLLQVLCQSLHVKVQRPRVQDMMSSLFPLTTSTLTHLVWSLTFKAATVWHSDVIVCIMHALLRVWHPCHRGVRFRLDGLKPDGTVFTDRSLFTEQERRAGLDWEKPK